jgi:hypothetical protein
MQAMDTIRTKESTQLYDMNWGTGRPLMSSHRYVPTTLSRWHFVAPSTNLERFLERVSPAVAAFVQRIAPPVD